MARWSNAGGSHRPSVPATAGSEVSRGSSGERYWERLFFTLSRLVGWSHRTSPLASRDFRAVSRRLRVADRPQTGRWREELITVLPLGGSCTLAGDLVVLVDDNDMELGYRDKDECHTVHEGIPGYHHRGLTVLVYDGNGVCCSSTGNTGYSTASGTSRAPLIRTTGMEAQEGYEEAALRCLKTEYSGVRRRHRGHFIRLDQLCGHRPEEPALLRERVLQAGWSPPWSRIAHKAENAYAHKWVKFGELVADVRNNPSDYAPWLTDLVEAIHTKKPHELSAIFSPHP